ncbi:hypothetical protein OPT61_g10572 [Boeremia exigua]|uniref:Uncharacterized protein n=1 Tax=Boeremia exigua TaxID=749465 RepID=A0ACC2HPW6_9PLEO|nr:hypothetical protein OPT61_g10572 [Boeremia exigua]
MGRGAYDLTDPTKDPSKMGGAALYLEGLEKNKREEAAVKKAEKVAEEKLIRSSSKGGEGGGQQVQVLSWSRGTEECLLRTGKPRRQYCEERRPVLWASILESPRC